MLSVVLCLQPPALHRFTLGRDGAVPELPPKMLSLSLAACRKVMIDNLKTGALSHPLGEKATFHPRYLDFAGHCGFHPVAVTYCKTMKKDRVEWRQLLSKKLSLRPSLLLSRSIPPAWIGCAPSPTSAFMVKTHRKPRDVRGGRKARLRALRALAYDAATQARDGHQPLPHHFEANRYSIPHLYASQKLALRLYPRTALRIYHQRNPHRHSYCALADRRQDIHNPDHARNC